MTRMSDSDIQKIIQMRQEGHSFPEIGLLFNKDHTTILYHCKKAGIVKIKTKKEKERIKKAVVGSKTSSFQDAGEVINKGFDYSEYLEKEEKRKRKFNKRKDIAERESSENVPLLISQEL